MIRAREAGRKERVEGIMRREDDGIQEEKVLRLTA